MDLGKQRLLVIAPHPDDEVLGCGGLISRVKAAGGAAYVLIVTVGDAPQYGSESKARTREAEAKEVMEFLKIDGWEIALPGNDFHLKLDSVPQRKLIDLIENESKVSLNKVKPTMVAFPARECANQDHQAVFKAAFTACRPRPANLKHFPKWVASFEQPDNAWYPEPFKPNFFVELSEGDLEKKISALALYKSQAQKEPHLRSIENVKRLAELRGNEIGVRAAEAFECYRNIV